MPSVPGAATAPLDLSLPLTAAWQARLERLIEAKLDMSGGLSACWPWTGARDGSGYGSQGLTAGKRRVRPYRISRLTYVLQYGPIPPGLHVLHGCDNRACGNPSHLRLGTHAENMRDKVLRGRAHRGEQIYGSKLTAEAVLAIKRALREAEQDGTWRKGGSLWGLGRAIAARFGVSPATICNIHKGETWRHVRLPD